MSLGHLQHVAHLAWFPSVPTTWLSMFMNPPKFMAIYPYVHEAMEPRRQLDNLDCRV